MTFVPTFSYGNSPVYFGLYYDSEKDVNAEAGSLNMNCILIILLRILFHLVELLLLV